MWNALLDGLREVVWWASVIGGLSAIGVGVGRGARCHFGDLTDAVRKVGRGWKRFPSLIATHCAATSASLQMEETSRNPTERAKALASTSCHRL